jgi:ubiquinone/menaquinone biosynthesis C-methylase UbiE
VLGIDIAENSIAQAKVQADLLGITNAGFRVSNILDVSLPNASFDVAHFSSVLAGRSGCRPRGRAPCPQARWADIGA